MKSYGLLLAVLLTILMVGCSSDIPTVSEGNDGQAQLAPAVALTEAQINQLILSKAASQNGRNTRLECKPWVNDVVYSSTKISVPAMSNYYSWVPSIYARIVWQFKPANYCISSFPTYLLPGQIVQVIKWRPSYMRGGPHTFIIISVLPGSIIYWECNGNAGTGRVGSWKDLISTWQSRAEAWTVYQIKSK